VLLRSDGTPTYMLAVVVDDHDMGVTHVIRGDDHLNNAFRQLALIRAMRWDEPQYAHIPLIHGADGAKLSKRHGALGVNEYRDTLGLLPEAVENYLLRLGWGHGDDEIISRAQAIAWFDLGAVNRGPSRFDMKKLESVNGHYLRAADDARLVALIAPQVEAALGRKLADADRNILQRSMAELKKRASNLNDLAQSSLFFLRTRPIPMDDGAAKLLASAAPGVLVAARALLAGMNDWSATALEERARHLAEHLGLKLGQVAQPDETLGRIDDALAIRKEGHIA
jgi:glutamyl-tRNA synthetase